MLWIWNARNSIYLFINFVFWCGYLKLCSAYYSTRKRCKIHLNMLLILIRTDLFSCTKLSVFLTFRLMSVTRIAFVLCYIVLSWKSQYLCLVHILLLKNAETHFQKPQFSPCANFPGNILIKAFPMITNKQLVTFIQFLLFCMAHNKCHFNDLLFNSHFHKGATVITRFRSRFNLPLMKPPGPNPGVVWNSLFY